jgi:hypothetical protein
MSSVYRVRLVASRLLASWKAQPWLRNEVPRSCGNFVATCLYTAHNFPLFNRILSTSRKYLWPHLKHPIAINIYVVTQELSTAIIYDMGTTAATTVVDPSEVNIDAMTYTQSAFGVNFFYLDQILDQMPPISKFIDQTPKDKNLGKLTILPSEVLLLVLETLSIIDLMRFRRCSRSSSQFVDKILQPILKVAPNTIKGLLALRVTTPITARQLFLKLRQRHCNGPECGALAQYMFLPTFARICFRCCACDPWEFKLLSLVFEEEIPPEHYQDLDLFSHPSFRMLPATFTNNMNKFKFIGRHKIYSVDRSSRFFETLEELSTRDGCDGLFGSFSYMPWKGWYYQQWNMLIQNPDRAEMAVMREPIPHMLLRHMCVVFAPWPDLTGSSTEQGRFCSTCLYTENQHILYTKVTFLKHLNDCRVRTPNTDYYQSWMPLDNFTREKPDEVCQMSLVTEDE